MLIQNFYNLIYATVINNGRNR